MNNATDSRTILLYAGVAAAVLSLIVVGIGVYQSFTHGRLQPLIGSGLMGFVVSCAVLMIAKFRGAPRLMRRRSQMPACAGG